MRRRLFNLSHSRARQPGAARGSRRELTRFCVLGGALWLGACGGSSFHAGSQSTAGGPSGGMSGEAGAGDSRGQSGEAGAHESGGEAGASGAADGGMSAGGAGGKAQGGAAAGTSAAGAGGKAAATCDCAAGTYCQDGTNKCRSCADFSRLQFAAPQKLATLSQTQGGNERFPRAASSGSDLFYRSGAVGAERIWYAATPVSGIGIPLSQVGRVESAPLLAPGVLEQNFFFDRLEVATNLRHIMLASWSGGLLTTPILAPAPLNEAGSDFSIAVAPGVARAYWMSTRTGKPAADLVWSGMVGGTASEPAVLDLEVQAGTGTCARAGDDATPWVNSAGTLLLFRNESVDDTCQPDDSGAFDLYAAPLSKDTGLATSAGIALSSLNNTGGASTETDPSLSQDSCLIYFASNNGTNDFDLYRAARN